MIQVESRAGERDRRAPQTVLRAMDALDLLAAAPRGLALRQLTQSMGLSKSTTHRLVSGLVSCGLVQLCPETRRYRLGLRLLELSAALLDSIDVREQARPFMQQLSDLSRETVHLGVLDRFEVVFIGHIESPESVRMSVRVGRRAPAYSTSLGKVLLAGLDDAELSRYLREHQLAALTPNTITDPERLLAVLHQVRSRGYSMDDEENRVGVRCLGAPVRDHTGRVVAAISVSGPAFRLTRERAGELVESLIHVSDGISERMGWSGPRRRQLS